MDLYNREIVAYTISECQDTNFVLDTLHQLELPQGGLLHSDQGSVYTSKAYYQPCIEKGITRSMSRKGTPADNACIEWFHSVLKSETFSLHKWRNITGDSITDIVKNYIIFYNETRIQQKLNDQSPVEYRELVVEGVQQPKGASLQIFLPKCVQNIDRIPTRKIWHRMDYLVLRLSLSSLTLLCLSWQAG